MLIRLDANSGVNMLDIEERLIQQLRDQDRTLVAKNMAVETMMLATEN